MPRIRQETILQSLKDLSTKADGILGELSDGQSVLDAWFSQVKEIATRIKESVDAPDAGPSSINTKIPDLVQLVKGGQKVTCAKIPLFDAHLRKEHLHADRKCSKSATNILSETVGEKMPIVKIVLQKSTSISSDSQKAQGAEKLNGVGNGEHIAEVDVEERDFHHFLKSFASNTKQKISSTEAPTSSVILQQNIQGSSNVSPDDSEVQSAISLSLQEKQPIEMHSHSKRDKDLSSVKNFAADSKQEFSGVVASTSSQVVKKIALFDASSYITPVSMKGNTLDSNVSKKFSDSLRSCPKLKKCTQPSVLYETRLRSSKRKSSSNNVSKASNPQEPEQKESPEHKKLKCKLPSNEVGKKDMKNVFHIFDKSMEKPPKDISEQLAKECLLKKCTVVIPDNSYLISKNVPTFVSRDLVKSSTGLTSLLAKSSQNPKIGVQKIKEIKIKEEKANETLKKVLTLRQMKVEENKRKRMEKMEKNLHQRMKMEKEKEERLKRSDYGHKRTNSQLSVELATKSTVVKKKGAKGLQDENASKLEVQSKKTSKRAKKIDGPNTSQNKIMLSAKGFQDENASKPEVQSSKKTPSKRTKKGNEVDEKSSSQNKKVLRNNAHEMSKTFKPGLSSVEAHSSIQNKPDLNKTYLTGDQGKKRDLQSYVMTPERKISRQNYSISSGDDEDDDDDAEPSGKPIPSWANGVHLKSALMHQHFNPVDINSLFGSVIEPPDLTKIFGVNKKEYNKRTSSAIWHSPDFPKFS